MRFSFSLDRDLSFTVTQNKSMCVLDNCTGQYSMLCPAWPTGRQNLLGL